MFISSAQSKIIRCHYDGVSYFINEKQVDKKTFNKYRFAIRRHELLFKVEEDFNISPWVASSLIEIFTNVLIDFDLENSPSSILYSRYKRIVESCENLK